MAADAPTAIDAKIMTQGGSSFSSNFIVTPWLEPHIRAIRSCSCCYCIGFHVECQQKVSTQGEKLTTKEAIQHFGGLKKLADALQIWPQVIYRWGDRPPMARQYEIEVKTEGKLRADHEQD
jgi:hypothetical protein